MAEGDASISQTPPEANPVTEDTELDQGSLHQPTDIDQTEPSVIQLLYDHSDESLVTCPQCNHTFNAEGLSEALERQSSSAYGLMDRGEISETIVEVGFSAPHKESDSSCLRQLCFRLEFTGRVTVTFNV